MMPAVRRARKSHNNMFEKAKFLDSGQKRKCGNFGIHTIHPNILKIWP
jgi:hypothetical protein